MSRIAASLAAVLAATALAGCGDGGAEPDAPNGGAVASRELTLILDFQPNAVHTGIYAALADGALSDRGIDLTVREPGASTDAPKLLRSGRADLAILDIHDLAIARQQGLDLVGVGAIVQRPLAAVIAADGQAVKQPTDLVGRTVGVTGLPSDDAVLSSVLAAGGVASSDVKTVTIGFEAVPALSAGRIDAATAFWNAEGVSLRDLGLNTREFRVDDYGAPSYPELVLVTTREKLEADREAIAATLAGIGEGYASTIADRKAALGDLLSAVPGLERGPQSEQLDAVIDAFDPSLALDRHTLDRWAAWEAQHGIVDQPPDVAATFDFQVAGEG